MTTVGSDIIVLSADAVKDDVNTTLLETRVEATVLAVDEVSGVFPREESNELVVL